MPIFRHSYHRGRFVLAAAALGTALTAPALAQTCPYDPRCLNNPYGSPYSNKSHTNPYATEAPKRRRSPAPARTSGEVPMPLQARHQASFDAIFRVHSLGVEACEPRSTSMTS